MSGNTGSRLGETCDEDSDEEEEPSEANLRTQECNMDSPAQECFGAVTLKVLARQGRW